MNQKREQKRSKLDNREKRNWGKNEQSFTNLWNKFMSSENQRREKVQCWKIAEEIMVQKWHKAKTYKFKKLNKPSTE